MNSLILIVHPNGAGSCLYSELIDLQSIGPLQVQRASTIEFNNQTQRWEVKNLKGRVLFFATTRQACVEWEQENLGG